MKRRTFVALPAVTAFGAATTSVAAAPPATAAATPAALESPGVLTGNLPAFYAALKDELTFPLAWGNSPVRDFRAWQRKARETFEELLFQPPDHTPFAPELLDEQPAEGYRQRTVAFNLTRHSRVRGALLLPEGRGPFPAVLLLHDHGSKFDIGKEKLVRPWYDDTRLASAQAWADKYFSGRFIGNELVRRGYAVLAVDALGWGDRVRPGLRRAAGPGQQLLQPRRFPGRAAGPGGRPRRGLPGRAARGGPAAGGHARVLDGRLPRLAAGRPVRPHPRPPRRSAG